MSAALFYGWKAFDQEVVEAIGDGSPAHVDKRADGGMSCPLDGHDDRLAWKDRDYKRGTERHWQPPVSFRVTPTYILCERLDNFIVGHDLVSAAIKGEWGKAETHRLGHENSEDAVSFNVFRSLQEAGSLHLVSQLVIGSPTPEPDLYLWGRRIYPDGSSAAWPELQAVRDRVERRHAQQTEPDVCLHIPDWGWIFIEAKLAHGIKTSQTAKKMDAWLSLYPAYATTLFDLERMKEIKHGHFPEQLLRNMLFADSIRGPHEWAHVVALGRKGDKTPISDWISACLASDCTVTTSQLTWEEIYQALPSEFDALSNLRRYFERKNYALRPAFDLGARSGPRSRRPDTSVGR